MKILLKDKGIIVQRVDTGNTVVILNRKDYVCKMKNILNDRSRFQQVYIDHDKVLNHLIHMSTKLSHVVFHLLDLFYLPSAHQHTNLQQVPSSNARTPNNL